MGKKVALITGVTWQDGSYLVEFLLEKGYEVHGIKRRGSSLNTERIDHLYENENFFLHYGDLTDTSSLVKLVADTQPDEIYNLGAMSHVKVSFEMPEYTVDVDGIGVLRLLEAIRINGLETKTKFYQASTSELYGLLQEMPQKETTPFYPRSPYGCAKLYAYWIVVNYRESYGMYACNGILFNHESPRRGETFVTRKITRAVARISLGLQDKISLGNLEAKRDWGHAKDYVYGMWLMLQQDTPEDFVLATGKTNTVRSFVENSFKEIGVTIEWKWEWLDEKWYDTETGKLLVDVDPKYFRPAEVEILLGDPTKAKQKLDWKPNISLENMTKEMVKSDIELFKKQEILKKHGYEILEQFD